MKSDAQIRSVAIHEMTMRFESGSTVPPSLADGSGGPSAVCGHDLLLPGRSWWDVAHEGVHELVLGVELQRGVVTALEADRRCRVAGQAASADRARVVSRVEEQVL